mgnify:CR=1 FL=1
MNIENVIKTKSGLYYRDDKEFGKFVFSPYTGLVYGIHPNYSCSVLDYLNGIENNIDPVFKKSLGVGWDQSLSCEFIKPHLLPAETEWRSNYTNRPIIINWLITGNCTHNCRYCYAEDLMRGKTKEPDEDVIIATVESILRYNPLVVVLTGGEPLLSPYLKMIVELLYEKAGIMVDTNGFLLTDEYIDFFKKYNVVLRISLDSPRPRVNDKLRPLNKKKFKSTKAFEKCFNALCRSLDKELTVVVQTVLTSENENELIEFGQVLVSLGVKAWRIQVVMPSILKQEAYKKLRTQKRKYRNKKSEKDFEYTIEALLSKHKNMWRNNISLQISNYGERASNNVILVSPDGCFYTESVVGNGKILIDKDNPKQPSIDRILNQVNTSSHFMRYMNI